MIPLKSSIWKEAPELAIPDWPALFCDSENLWLCYAVAPSSPETRDRPKLYAIIHYSHVVEHRLTPINDEGLGRHPYAKAGLKFYSFNEITGSQETIRWSVLEMRHWAITFKDNTLDVIAEEAKVVANNLHASSATFALIEFLRHLSD